MSKMKVASVRYEKGTRDFSGLSALLAAALGLLPAGARAADIQTEWDAVSGAAAASPRIDNNIAAGTFDSVFDIETAGGADRIYFVETPGPNNWVNFTDRTSVGHGDQGEAAPLPIACDPRDGITGNPRCDRPTLEECVDARAFLQNPLNSGSNFRCLAGTALVYARILGRIERCSARCFVDVTSLGNTAILLSRTPLVTSPMIADAAALWAVRNRPNPNARLTIRITEGFPANEFIRGEFQQLDRFLTPAPANPARITQADLDKIDIRGMALSSDAVFAGNWSHAKLFAVLDAGDPGNNIAMLGGQNHWPDYFRDDGRVAGRGRPFDGNVVLEGPWARGPSYGLDGAIAVFSMAWGNRNPPYYLFRPPTPALADLTAGPAGLPIMRISAKGVMGDLHPNITTNIPAAAIPFSTIAEVDLGNYSRAPVDRVALFGLGAVTRAQRPENADNTITSWTQGFCGVTHCGGAWRHDATFLRSVAWHIVRPAELGAAASKSRHLMGGNSTNLSRYAGGPPANVLAAFQANASWQACSGIGLLGFAPGYGARTTDVPAGIRWGNMNCWQSAYRLVPLRSQLGTARARNNLNTRAPAGQHHKIYMFDNALFVSSFNPYPSSNHSGIELDSQLIENGLWTFDQPTRTSIMTNFNAAWGMAFNQWGNPGGGGGMAACAQHSSCTECTPDPRCGWCGDRGACVPGNRTGPTAGPACAGYWAWTIEQCN